jgi:translocation and assembly module TamB
MKRWLKYAIIVSVFLVGFTWATFWLLGTPEGARWLLGAISRWSPVKIEAERVSGRIVDELHLEGVNIDWPEGRMQIDRFLMRWQPADLFLGKITLKDVNLDRLRLQDDRSESKTSPDLTLPKIPGPPAGLHLEVRSFRLNELIYRRLDRSFFKVVNISGHLSWHRSFIRVKRFAFEGPNGHAEVKGELNFLQPSLSLDLGFSPKEPLMGLHSLWINLQLLPAQPPEQMAGEMLITAKPGTTESIELKGELGITPHALKLRRLLLSQSGRNGTVAADGGLNFSPEKSLFRMNMKLKELDFSRDLSIATTVSGHLDVEGDLADYHGSFDLRNTQKVWHEAHLAGTFQGDLNGIKVSTLEGTLLDGTLKGQAEASWGKGFSILGTLLGRKLDPSKITSEWKGQINLNLDTNFRWTETGPLQGKVVVHLLESHLRGKALTGDIDAELDRGILRLRKGELRGKGFYLFSHGVLQEHINFDARVSDLSGLIPGARGSFLANGWTRLRNHHLSGSLTSQGNDLLFAGAQVQRVNVVARLDEGEKRAVDLRAKAQGLAYGFIQVDSASLNVTGSVSSHKGDITIQWPNGDAQGVLAGVYTKEGWEGTINRLTGNHPRGRPWSLQAPVVVSVSMGKLNLTPFTVVSQTGERVKISADLVLRPIHGVLEVEWQQVDLGRASPYLGRLHLLGHTTGKLEVQRPDEDRLRLNAMVNVTGTLHDPSMKFELSQGSVNLRWDEKGLFASWELESAEGGKAHGQLSSPHPARFAIPPQGKLDVTWEGIDLGLLRPWLPPALAIEGHLAGQLDGRWMTGLRLNVKGGMKISQGSFSWKGKNGVISTRLKMADLNLSWIEEQLAGEISLALEKYGHVKGNFKLPLPARLPTVFQAKDPVFLFLEAQVQEKGLIQTLFPEWIQESQGTLGLKLTSRGTWKEPQIEGHLKLTGAGAYLPTAGVHLKELGAEVLFTGAQIRINSFRVRSGPGQIEGTALLQLRDWKISHFEGHLKGDRFQTVYLPELQILTSPHLVLEGTGEKLAVRGEILIPELLLRDHQTKGVIRPSLDVVIVDEKETFAPSVAFPFDIQVHVILGDKVLVKAEGIDARLTGDLSLRGENSKEMVARGEIQVAQGHYNAYGQKLEITRGRLLFNGPADRPTLDVLALRKIGRGFEEVQAGVTVTGPIQSPLIRLYSKPAMPETDILSYIVLGHPLSKGGDKEQTTLLMEAAGALLSAGESVLLKNQLSGGLGIDTLDVQTGGGDISRSLVTVGKYLNPRLYVGLGGSLFTNTYQIILRYSLTKNLEVESKTGTVSGANIYFKIEFD